MVETKIIARSFQSCALQLMQLYKVKNIINKIRVTEVIFKLQYTKLKTQQ